MVELNLRQLVVLNVTLITKFNEITVFTHLQYQNQLKIADRATVTDVAYSFWHSIDKKTITKQQSTWRRLYLWQPAVLNVESGYNTTQQLVYSIYMNYKHKRAILQNVNYYMCFVNLVKIKISVLVILCKVLSFNVLGLITSSAIY